MNAAALAAHDAGQSHGASAIANQQRIFRWGDFAAIEKGQCVPGPSEAHLNALAQAVKIKGVHGLAQLKHYVVGDIHHGVDASQTRATEPLRHPVGCGAGDVHALDDSAQVARTGVRRRDGHGEGIVNGGGHRGAGLGAEIHAIQHGELPGQTADGQAIAPVWREVDLKNPIVQIQRFPEIRPRLQAGR